MKCGESYSSVKLSSLQDIKLSASINMNQCPVFKISAIQPSSFTLPETAHVSEPISIHYSIQLPYKLTDPNQVFLRKIFLFYKIFSRNLAQLICKVNATIFEKIIQIGPQSIQLSYKLTEQNQAKDLCIHFYAIRNATVKCIIASATACKVFYYFVCLYVTRCENLFTLLKYYHYEFLLQHLFALRWQISCILIEIFLFLNIFIL